jgi:hypothetical protein
MLLLGFDTFNHLSCGANIRQCNAGSICTYLVLFCKLGYLTTTPYYVAFESDDLKHI